MNVVVKTLIRLVPDGTFKLTKRNKYTEKIVTFMWRSNDMLHYMFKAEFVTHASVKVPSGSCPVTVLFARM